MVLIILGTPYTLERLGPEEDEMLKECDGYCDSTNKKMVVTNEETAEGHTLEDPVAFRSKQIRHEIVHAFLAESGLEENSPWADNEEIVDWIAIQGPKLYKAWQEAGAV